MEFLKTNSLWHQLKKVYKNLPKEIVNEVANSKTSVSKIKDVVEIQDIFEKDKGIEGDKSFTSIEGLKDLLL